MGRRKGAPSAPLPDNVVPIAAARRSARARPAGRRVGAEVSEAAAIDSLERALRAKTAEARARHAREGLARACDAETRALLLRQLYLGELESGHYERALAAAEQMIDLDVLPDVARQDAARACQALARWDDAVAHLEEAARVGPEQRRPLHLSMLGGLLYALGRADEAVEPLARAVRQAASPLFRGQLALARSRDLDAAYRDLSRDPSAEGYGRFVLGELAFARGDREQAQRHLESFLARVKRARPAARAALAPEVARARATLGRIVLN